MKQNVSILVALSAVLALGLWGQYLLDPDRFGNQFLTVSYEILMLFALEGEWTIETSLPWQLEVTRVLAPAVTVAGIVLVLTRGAWINLTNFFVRYWKDHIVIVGLGETGWRFVQACTPAYKVVVVDRNAANPLIERARAEGVPVIVGEWLEERVMSAAGIGHARHLVTFCGNDGVSVEAAIRTRELLQRQSAENQRRLRIHLHVGAMRIASRLEHYSKFHDNHQVAEVDFFGVNDLAARMLLKKYPPDSFAAVMGRRTVHFALYGFGDLARQVLTEAVRVCHFLNAVQVRFTIIDPQAESRLQSLLDTHPGLVQLCDLACIDDVKLPQMPVRNLSEELLQSVTQHVICLERDDENLELALMLRAELLSRKDANAPICVRMQYASGLARLLEADEGSPEIPDGIYPFGMLDEALTPANILSDVLDNLAQALHQDYLDRRAGAISDTRFYTSVSEWGELSESDRKSSRLQADHLAVKLRAIGCASREGPPNDFRFTEHEAEILAAMEHNRWRANKIFEGWREGAERIEGAKVNPFAVPWEALDERERQSQIQSIKRLPQLLQARLGHRLEREFLIGVTGHRPGRSNLDGAEVTDGVIEVLERLAEQNRDKRVILVSSLAEGADRLVARVAMERCGMALHVPLPLPFELYQTDFESKESVEEFKELIGRAEWYYELPMRYGSIEALASRVHDSHNEARNRQYALAGAYVARICHELIAVYDGKPSRGTGGTADVVAWRTTCEIPQELQLNSDLLTYPEMTKPIIVNGLGGG